MDVFLWPLIDEALNRWVNITMYAIFKPIGEKEFNSIDYLHERFMKVCKVQCNSTYTLSVNVFFLIFKWNSINIVQYLTRILTKGKYVCLVCHPRTISRNLRSLGKKVYDKYRHFLPRNHRYQTTKKNSLMDKKRLGKNQE